ncbi:MAG: site-specific integrase, partial [Flavobacteriaceae bacterium]
MEWKKALEDFGHYLSIERGLSDNTVTNYQRDVQALMRYLESRYQTASPISIQAEEIQQFIYEEAKEKSAYSQSRRISGLKSFFKYLI